MQPAGHLTLMQFELVPSAEWTVSTASWCILRLSSGVAYCFAGKAVLELPVGDTLVVRPGQSIVIRASQIGAAQLHYFHFQAGRLIGLLTMTEQRRLAELARAEGEAFWQLPAAHPAAAQFSVLCKGRGRDGSFAERCQFLEVAALLFAPSLVPSAPPGVLPTSALARFVELTETASEAEILGASSAELATRCGCSPRHFARMFHARFGVSLRSRQTQLRLEKGPPVAHRNGRQGHSGGLGQRLPASRAV